MFDIKRILPNKEYYVKGEAEKCHIRRVECKGIIGQLMYKYDSGLGKGQFYLATIVFYILLCGFAWTWIKNYDSPSCWIVGPILITLWVYYMLFVSIPMFHWIEEKKLL